MSRLPTTPAAKPPTPNGVPAARKRPTVEEFVADHENAIMGAAINIALQITSLPGKDSWPFVKQLRAKIVEEIRSMYAELS